MTLRYGKNPTDVRLRALVEREQDTSKLRALLRERDEIHGSAPTSQMTGGYDGRANPDTIDEDWALGNQLEFGPRVEPHRS